MSPFFRGSVRPTKKHPRPWSLNPKLNPDLGTDGGVGAHVSLLGLPSQQTTVTLPVFNGVYSKPDEELLAIPPAHHEENEAKVNEEVPAKVVVDDAAGGLPKTEKVAAETSAPLAETVGVTGEPPSREDVGVTNEVEPASASVVAEDAQEPTPEPAEEAHIGETSLRDTPAPEAQETLAAQPSVSSYPALTSDSAVVDDPAHHDSQETVQNEPPKQVGTGFGEQVEEERTEPAGHESQPVPVQAEEESSEPAEQAVVSAPPPSEAVAEGVLPPVRESPVEPLATISEEPPAGAQQTLPTEPPPVPVEDPSLPTISEEHQETGDEVVDSHEESAQSQEADHDSSHAFSTGGIEGEGAKEPAEEEEEEEEEDETEALLTEEHSAAAEAPIVPRRLDDSEDTATPAAVSGEGDQATSTEHHRVVSHGPHASTASTSVEGSVANEPLITDEQLEVSDEFKPGVATYTTEPSQ
ncbi:hypothetical protein M406DRAFT_107490 [Cryphonectria parasitica EP155]|uniref:Uncharacterized protein n=1 Tax=Cryphonectria parasitica (strain ATCC 38755 / EP155) TaxID=660469 RepID=A0A9P4Y8Y3_CRYP1|nr:uncharacterized protein M406DRAFT_107490 [Cryphonectria parasitica EP155]KAF3768599.1 hypothetical protein M406DRAFT_107490 [Cryphonectria parasitica EP155]